MNNLQPGERLHGIDALRAIAMILGIFLHATIAYKQFPIPTWPHDSTYNHLSFDFVYVTLHTFRMPLFFLIAGFFCRFLLHKIGEHDFIEHRWKRIGLPFICSLIFLLPVTIFPFLVYRNTAFYSNWAGNFNTSFKQLLHWNGMAHLWFLYYLLIYYVIVIFSRRVFSYFRMTNFVSKINASWQHSNWPATFLFIFSAACLWFLLLQSPELFISVNTGIIPDPLYLSFYGLFFMLGWFIHIKPVVFSFFAKNAWYYLLPGLLLAIYTFYIVFQKSPAGQLQGSIVFYKCLVSVQVILLVFGTIGIFLRYFKKESYFWRYISDASYWMYLLHLGLVAGLQLIMSYSGIYGPFRFWVVLVLTLFITLTTYHYFIRFSIVGKYLHGNRSRRK